MKIKKLPACKILELLKQGKTLPGKLVFIKWHSLAAEPVYWQVVAPIKVAKQAVARNKLKRQMREIIRGWLREHRLSGGEVLVVLKEPGTFGELRTDMERQLNKLLRN